MEFRVLGPLEVHDGGGSVVPIRAAKQRALLLILLLHANEVVSSEQLIDLLWGERPPDSAANALQTYVSQLRRLLEPAEHNGEGKGDHPLIATRSPGYELRLGPGQLDRDRFTALVAEARSTTEPGERLRTLQDALALWRGPPLQEFLFEEFAQREIARLEELRLATIEERVDLELRLGGHADLIGELEELVAEHPLRERLRAQLMLALYRCGRQAEALQVYQGGRRLLVEELGLEPSRQLRELETSILRQDPALELPDVTPARPEPPARRRVLRRRPLLIAMLGGLAAAAVVVFLLGERSSGRAALASVGANSVGAIDPVTGRIVASIPVGERPDHVATGGGAVWVANSAAGTVSRIDPTNRTVVEKSIPVGHDPSGIAVGGGSVWVANALDGTVSRISTATDRVVQTIPIGNGPSGLAFGEGAVWVALLDGRVARLDPVSGNVVRRIPAQGSPSGIAVGGGSVWTSNTIEGAVSRIDPRTNTVVGTFRVGNGPTAIAAGPDAVWVANSLDGTVSRIDPRTNRVITIQVGEGPSGVAVAPGVVLVANEFAQTVTRIDPRTNAIAGSTKVGNRPQAVALANGVAWFGADVGGAAHSGGTLRIVARADPCLLQLVGAFDCGFWPITSLTGDGLTAFRRVGGAAGATIVPDLAIALPAATDGGRTYTFQLRSGIRYSTGALVRPADVGRAIERVFELGSPDTGFFTGIVGAEGCPQPNRPCDLSAGIVADGAHSTVTFHLVAPDPEFFYKLALPPAYVVPAGTRAKTATTHPPPGTGPYAIRWVPGRALELVRNPYFHSWSAAARPAGYVDRILYHLLPAKKSTWTSLVRAVERGSADNAFTLFPSAVYQELATRYPELLRVSPGADTAGLSLNTKLPPFDHLAVRQALSYAVDRRVAVRYFNAGGEVSRPTCQLLPANFPGYEPYCPYTLDRSAGGAPDLARARALVARSGTRGTRIVLWTKDFEVEVAGYFTSVLRRLGYPTSVRVLGFNEFDTKVKDARFHVQAAVTGWAADYPSPGDFFGVLFTCAGTENIAHFCDHRIDAQIAQADRLQADDPDRASKLWASLDRAITDQAPWVFVRLRDGVDVVSARVGNYQYSPQWGVLLDQLSVR